MAQKPSVCSVSFLLHLQEFDVLELRPQLIHWSLKYLGVERPNFEIVSCRKQFRARVRMWNDCHNTMFDTRTQDGVKGAVNRWLLP